MSANNILVIAEKPSVGMNLAAVLGARERKDGYVEGNGYIVSWCVGHLVGLADAYEYNEQYGKWRREDLPIIPGYMGEQAAGQTDSADAWKYVVFGGKEKQFNILRGLMNRKDVDSLICATDAGREGELIFRFVYNMAECKKSFSRLWISSMEESAIKAGFANMKPGSLYDPLYHSAICRAKADWLIGINATRLFSTLYNRTLNVGRVQTPTLAMLAERQKKISGFVKEKYHRVKLDIETDTGGENGGNAGSPGDNGNIATITAHSENIKDPQDAANIQTACHTRQAVCTSLTKEQKTISPPKLFDLTSLQREANRFYGYTAQQTLNAAQKLYELKLITYPRTDSNFITSDMVAGIPALAQNAANFIGMGAEQTGADVPVNTGQVVNDSKVSDHHAIIITAEVGKAGISKVTDTEREILALIAYRLVCAVGEKHIYEAITATFDCNGHSFTAKGRVTLAGGWKENARREDTEGSSYGDSSGDNDNHSGARLEADRLPPITEGQTFNDTAAAVTEHYTQPPKPYTEADLLLAMENAGAKDTTDEAERRGLGTPATRAAVIEKLVTGGFITRKGRQLIPTPDGENLIAVLPAALTSPALTAEWENALTQIAKGEVHPHAFINRIEDMARALVEGNAAPAEEYKNLFATPREAVGVCPRCTGNVLESKKNFHCENRECLFVMWKQDRFFTSRKKELTKAVAAELLKSGKAKMTGLYSEKKNKNFDAVILLADTGGKYVNYRFDFPGQKPQQPQAQSTA